MEVGMWEGGGMVSYLLAVNAMAQRSEIIFGYPPSISLKNTDSNRRTKIIKYKPSTA
jgi:hypothetical protein